MRLYSTETFPLLDHAAAEFLEDLAIEGRASTAKTYRVHLRDLRELPKHTNELTPADCRQIASDAVARDLAPATVRLRVHALSSFCNWCVERGYMVDNLARSVPKPKKRAPQHRYLTPETLRALMAAARSEYDRLALFLLAGSGLRNAEFCRLRWQDIDFERGIISVHGKGKKWREVAPGDAAMTLLRTLRSMNAGDQVIPFGEENLRVRVGSMGRRAGVRVHPHMLRHSFAVEYLRASDGDAFSLQELLGHATPAMTGYYVRSYRQQSATSRQRTVDLAGRLFGGVARV